MSTVRVVSATIDTQVEEQASEICAAAGLTLSDAFRIMLLRTVADRALPFDPFTPNAATIEAMQAARRKEVVRIGTVEDLMADLHADD